MKPTFENNKRSVKWNLGTYEIENKKFDLFFEIFKKNVHKDYEKLMNVNYSVVSCSSGIATWEINSRSEGLSLRFPNNVNLALSECMKRTVKNCLIDKNIADGFIYFINSTIH